MKDNRSKTLPRRMEPRVVSHFVHFSVTQTKSSFIRSKTLSEKCATWFRFLPVKHLTFEFCEELLLPPAVASEAENITPPSTCFSEGTCVLFMLLLKLCMKPICIFACESMFCVSAPIYASKLQSEGYKFNVVFEKHANNISVPQSGRRNQK